MNSWEQEIVVKNTERILSIAFQLENVHGFEKSLLGETAPVKDDQIEKSGKEIKEKLQPELLSIQAEKKAIIDRMGELVKSIGQVPDEKTDRSVIKGFEEQILDVPKQYGYAQIYADRMKSKVEEMREFNLMIGDYFRKSIEEVKLKTTIEGLPDSNKMKLTSQLAKQLGF